MGHPDDARIAASIERASDAFWAAFAAEFPEVSGGDLDPITTVRFDKAVERAAHEWLRANWPDSAATN